MKTRTIILACGGTGGHIFPGLSTAEELKRRDPSTRVVFVCGKKDIENAIFKVVKNERVVSIDSAPFQGKKSAFSATFWSTLWKGTRQSLKILKEEKPDLVVGYGGYFSFPVVLAAKILRIPAMLHEQNVEPGVANKYLMKMADSVALSFKETEKRLKPHRNRRVTGNPIRSSIERDCRSEALDFFSFSPERKTLLVLGGSQGAESINTFFLGALIFLPDAVKRNLQVLHLCGRLDPKVSEEVCLARGVAAVKAFSFFDRMDMAYGASDLCLGRAGATFLAEIKAKGLPAILVPYPYGNGHQRDNAEAFRQGGMASVIEQRDLTEEKLARLIEEGLAKTEEGARPQVSNSRALLTDFIYECIKR